MRLQIWPLVQHDWAEKNDWRTSIKSSFCEFLMNGFVTITFRLKRQSYLIKH